MRTADLFRAYFDCRRNKRKTRNATLFELDYEEKLFELYDEIVSRTYRVGKCMAFIVDKPVKREIFAGDFRDRVVHHYVVGELEAIFERTFIHDSYACRKGKGALFWIARAEKFARSVSAGHSKKAYVLKLDIAGFFMSIDRGILLGMLERIIAEEYSGDDPETLLFLVRTILTHDPTENCVIRGNRADWAGLPKNKSLFSARKGTGLPIGNLTSQTFANLYLHPLDEFVKRTLKIRRYCRYVDDFLIFHEDADHLKSLVPVIREFLSETLRLTLHPDKVLLREISDGFPFLGGYVKPRRTYVWNRTKSNFAATVRKWNGIAGENGLPESETPAFLASMNAYLGLLWHFDAYALKKKILRSDVSSALRRDFRIGGKYSKIMRKH